MLSAHSERDGRGVRRPRRVCAGRAVGGLAGGGGEERGFHGESFNTPASGLGRVLLLCEERIGGAESLVAAGGRRA